MAVSIALVPPLAVVGITLRGGDFAQASGALLLFATNLVSILVAASVVFLLTGYASMSSGGSDARHRRTSYSLIAIGLFLLLIPLGLTGRSVVEDARNERTVQRSVDEWLGEGSDFVVSRLHVEGDAVELTLLGPGDPPPVRSLYDRLRSDLEMDPRLELRVVPEQVYRIDG